MSGEARLEMLTRIGRAGATRQEALPPQGVQASSRPRQDVLDQFAEYAAEYRARVTRCAEAELPQTLRGLLGQERAILPPGLPPAWLPDGLDAVTDQGQDHRALSRFGAVISGCRVAVAETGTVVLDHGPGQGRRALTLIPDHHVCVVFGEQVVDSVPEAVERLRESVLAGHPLTWISGPSATSDIELSRVEGVHGPRRLDVVLVPGEAPL